jgi:hypothetical protein
MVRVHPSYTKNSSAQSHHHGVIPYKPLTNQDNGMGELGEIWCRKNSTKALEVK